MGLRHHRISSSSSMLQLLFLLIICCCFIVFTTSVDTISVNQSLSDSDTLFSIDEKFKLGFFSLENSSYRYVGIMYNLPVMTVIWVANRETPLNDSSGTIQISGDGNLVILDGREGLIWSSNIPNKYSNNSSTAVLLDTGNLVLQDHNKHVVWESFRHASDSLVEKMKVVTDLNTSEKDVLTSWRSLSDPGPGIFTSTIEPLVIPQLFIWKNGLFPYWRSGQWNGQIFIGIPHMKSFNQRGISVFRDSPGTVYLNFTVLNSSLLIYYQLTTFGSLEEKLWSQDKGDWMVTWSSLNNECDIYGKCGPFGSCNNQERTICTCFPGFEPKSNDEWKMGNWSNGCVRKTGLQCGRNSSVEKPDGFLKMDGVKLPDGGKSYPTMEADCGGECLNNCSCIAYAYTAGIGCLMWDGELIDVQKFSEGVADLYIRLPYSELGNKKDRRKIIATTTVLGSITIVVCLYIVWKLLKFRGGRRSTMEETDGRALQHNARGPKLEELPLFKFQTLLNATDRFDLGNKLGQGGFGPVYKGKLLNGQEIVVKRLARSSKQGTEELMNEVEVISKLQHRNLVRLIGCCVEHEEKLLVYEYMSNGSLDSYLFDSHKKEFLDWKTRTAIIEGICRGIVYLHRDSRLRIIHRDLKASNILLDDELNPKISDFGMARIFRLKEDEANTTRVVGTYGYMSPEYALHGIFSEKSDVYSFGVLLIEIVSGKRNTSFYHEEQQLFLIAYVWKLWNEEEMVHLIDPAINDPGIENEIVRYANVGLLCVQEVAADRPSISTVLSMLSCEIVELPRPKKPAFFGIQRSSETGPNPSKCSLTEVSVTIVEEGR